MGRPKGAISKRPNRYQSKEDKYDYVKVIQSGETSIKQLAKDNGISRGMLSTWGYRHLADQVRKETGWVFSDLLAHNRCFAALVG